MKRLHFFVDGFPVPQGSMRSPKAGLVLHSSNERLNAWRTMVGWHARQEMKDDEPIGGTPMAVWLDFYLERPKSVKRASPSVKPDLDKLVRAVLDALEDVVYVNDSQVTSICAAKMYVPPDERWPETAGVDIQVLVGEDDLNS